MGSTTSDIGHSQRIILQREDIVEKMLRSEKYDIYTEEEGYTSIESDAEAVGKTLGEYKKMMPEKRRRPIWKRFLRTSSDANYYVP